MPTNTRGDAFDRELFEALCVEAGLDKDAERARALGFHQSTVYRIQNGEQTPSLQFANACRRVFGLEAFVNLFPLATTEETADEHLIALQHRSGEPS
jgi:transcriptional regulator with XRE-family HTH domain